MKQQVILSWGLCYPKLYSLSLFKEESISMITDTRLICYYVKAILVLLSKIQTHCYNCVINSTAEGINFGSYFSALVDIIWFPERSEGYGICL